MILFITSWCKPLSTPQCPLTVPKLTLNCIYFFNAEKYHQRLKHSCNFDKKQRSETIFFSVKLYIQLTHARIHF